MYTSVESIEQEKEENIEKESEIMIVDDGEGFGEVQDKYKNEIYGYDEGGEIYEE